MTVFNDQVIIDIDEHPDVPGTFEVVARHTPEDMIVAYSDVPQADLKARMRDVADNATASLLATFHDLREDTSKHPEPGSYEQAVAILCDLIEPEDIHPQALDDSEYIRGAVELLADLHGREGVELGDRKEEVLADMIRHVRPYAVCLAEDGGVVERFRTHVEAVAFVAGRREPDAWRVEGPPQS